MKIIELIVDPQGQTKLQTKGFAGAACRQASRALEQALGLVQSDQATAELYQTAVSEQAALEKASQ